MTDATQLPLDFETSPSPASLHPCNECGAEYPLSAFRRNSHYRSGYQLVCSQCSKAAVRRSRGVEASASYLQPTEAERCGICGFAGGRGLFLDHDHETGDFRGWLCHRCNAGLGHFDDDPSRLQSAIRYLTALP